MGGKVSLKDGVGIECKVDAKYAEKDAREKRKRAKVEFEKKK